MTENTQKISTLEQANKLKEASVFPVSLIKGDGELIETFKIDLQSIRSAINFENAFNTVAEGIASTEDGGVFFVYVATNKYWVKGYTRDKLAAIALKDKNNNDVTYPTSLFVSEIIPETISSMGAKETAGKIGISQGGTIQSALTVVTPQMFGAKADGVSNDSPALILADAKAKELGFPLDGGGLVYAVGGGFRFDCAYVRNIKLLPTPTYTGAAPTFLVNPVTGKCVHENVEITGFKLTGTKIFNSSLFTGIPEAIFRGVNRYNNNGNLIRTTTTTDIHTGTSFTLSVVSSVGFAANDYIQIGDGKYRILSISNNTLTLYNDGTGSTLYGNAGSRYLNYTGQYVTKNQGEDNNGIRIGGGDTGWNLKISGLLEAIGNGWSGLFHYNKTYNGYHEISGIRAYGNGYIGVGLGYTNKGYLRDCISEFNGNNGFDTFESKQTYAFDGNTAVGNGVDNFFIGGDAECAVVRNNIAINAQRIGILINGRTNAVVGLVVHGNQVLGNKLRSIGLTGVKYGKIDSNTVGRANNYSIFIEGKAGLDNPTKIEVVNNTCYTSTAGDIGGNMGNNTSFPAGSVDLINNNTFDRLPVVSLYLNDFYRSKFSPETLIAGTGSYTAVAGANVAVSVTLRRPHDSQVTDTQINKEISISISTSSTGTDQSTVSAAVMNSTYGVEILNTATTRGKIIVIPDNGSISYNFKLNTAGTRYFLFDCGGFKKVVTVVWTESGS